MFYKSRSAVLFMAYNQTLRFKFKCKVKSYIQNNFKMCPSYAGKIEVPANQLNLEVTLVGGQSFRWRKYNSSDVDSPLFHGVAYNAYWELKQTASAVSYTVFPAPDVPTTNTHKADYYQELLRRYFRLDFDLNKNMAKWRTAHEHFDTITPHIKAVRVLDQEPLLII